MAFQLVGNHVVDQALPLIEWGLVCYDTIGDPDFDLDRDTLLRHRSAYELVRDQLSDEQRAELDQVDAFWRENAEAFNASFALEQSNSDPKTALKGYVTEDGKVPPVPRSHWWWRAL